MVLGVFIDVLTVAFVGLYSMLLISVFDLVPNCKLLILIFYLGYVCCFFLLSFEFSFYVYILDTQPPFMDLSNVVLCERNYDILTVWFFMPSSIWMGLLGLVAVKIDFLKALLLSLGILLVLLLLLECFLCILLPAMLLLFLSIILPFKLTLLWVLMTALLVLVVDC